MPTRTCWTHCLRVRTLLTGAWGPKEAVGVRVEWVGMDAWRARGQALGLPENPPTLSCLVPTDLGQLQSDPQPAVVAVAQVSAQQVELAACEPASPQGPRLPCLGQECTCPARPPPIYTDSPFRPRSLKNRWNCSGPG